MTKLDCSEVRDLIHAFVDEELSADERQAVATHLAGCRDCTQALAELERLRQTLASAGTFAAPPHVEARARVAIGLAAGAERRWSRRSIAAMAATHALIAALAAGGAIWLVRHVDREERAIGDIVAAHVRASFADAPVQIASSDQHSVRPWFAGRIDYAPPVRDLAADGYPLIGGRVDYVLGRTAAALVYGRRKHRISVFIVPETRAALPAPLTTATAMRDGYNVSIWRADGFLYAAASDLNRGELDQVKVLLARQN